MNKITGKAILLAVVIVGGLLSYVAHGGEQGKVAKLLEIELPMEQAVREVEVSLWETSNAIFYYMVKPSQTALQEYRKQLGDVTEFMATYEALTDTEQEKQLTGDFKEAWADAVSKAEGLLTLRDKIVEVEERAWDAVHEVDDTIDYKIQPIFVAGLPDLIEKEQAIREVEVSIWEAINATNFYLYKRSDKAQREFPDHVDDVDEFLRKYKNLSITSTEEPYIQEFEALWSSAVEQMNECRRLADELAQQELAFWEAIHAADDLIDFRIQEHLKGRIAQATK